MRFGGRIRFSKKYWKGLHEIDFDASRLVKFDGKTNRDKVNVGGHQVSIVDKKDFLRRGKKVGKKFDLDFNPDSVKKRHIKLILYSNGKVRMELREGLVAGGLCNGIFRYLDTNEVALIYDEEGSFFILNPRMEVFEYYRDSKSSDMVIKMEENRIFRFNEDNDRMDKGISIDWELPDEVPEESLEENHRHSEIPSQYVDDDCLLNNQNPNDRIPQSLRIIYCVVPAKCSLNPFELYFIPPSLVGDCMFRVNLKTETKSSKSERKGVTVKCLSDDATRQFYHWVSFCTGHNGLTKIRLEIETKSGHCLYDECVVNLTAYKRVKLKRKMPKFPHHNIFKLKNGETRESVLIKNRKKVMEMSRIHCICSENGRKTPR